MKHEQCTCHLCGQPLYVTTQERRAKPPLLQLECRTPDCPLFECTTYAESYAQYVENAPALLSKWGVKVSAR